MTTLPIDPSYRDAFRTAIVVQLLLTVVLALTLDGGRVAAAGGCAMIGFWIGVAIVVLRRPRVPRVADLLYVRWGYIPLLILGTAIGLSGQGALAVLQSLPGAVIRSWVRA